MSDRACPICQGEPRNVDEVPLRDELTYLCVRCGLFTIARLRAETLPELFRSHASTGMEDALRSGIRKENVKGEIPIIDSRFIDDSLNREQSD